MQNKKSIFLFFFLRSQASGDISCYNYKMTKLYYSQKSQFGKYGVKHTGLPREQDFPILASTKRKHQLITLVNNIWIFTHSQARSSKHIELFLKKAFNIRFFKWKPHVYSKIDPQSKSNSRPLLSWNSPASWSMWLLMAFNVG